MADKIVVGGKGFEGVIAKFNVNCVSDIKIAPEVDWVSFYLDTNTVRMIVGVNDMDESRTTAFTISYSAETDTSSGVTPCQKEFVVEQLSKNFNPDTGSTDCAYFIVDGGTWDDAPATGASACDSAFLYYEGRPKFDPESGADWIHPEFYRWNDGQTPHTTQFFCSLYDNYPCVAEAMLRYAGLSPSTRYPKCENGTATLNDFKNDTNGYRIVYDTIKGTTSDPRLNQALGTIWYHIDQNTNPYPRSCTIKWFVNNIECESVEFRITQFGISGGTGGCSVSLSFTNMASKTSKIYWDADSTRYEEKTGNGPHTYTYPSGIEHTFKIVAEGYETYYGKFFCGSQETIEISMKPKETPCKTCEDLGIHDISVNMNIPATGGTRQTIATFYTNCEGNFTCINVDRSSGMSISTLYTHKPITKYYAILGDVNPNTSSSVKEGIVAIFMDGSTDPCVILHPKQLGGACKHPGRDIQVFFRMQPNNYDYYVITNNEIGENCKNWVLNSGYKYDGDTVEDAGVSLGYYHYTGCEVAEYRIGGKYCKINSPGSTTCEASNETLVANTQYTIYGHNTTGLHRIGTARMPSEAEAQENSVEEGGQLIIYMGNI